jgi:hypothetical protein
LKRNFNRPVLFFNSLIAVTTSFSALYLAFSKSISNDQVRERAEVLLVLILLIGAIVVGLATRPTSDSFGISSQVPRSKLQLTWAISSTLIVLLSLSYQPKAQFPYLWHGYGVSVTFACALILSTFVMIQKFRAERIGYLWSRISSYGSLICVAITGIVYLPEVVQPQNGIINGSDATHQVIEEIVGPLVGNYPGVNYLGTYTTILGLPLVPLRVLGLSNGALMLAVIIWVNLLTLMTILGLYAILRAILPSLSKGLTLLCVNAFVLVSGSWGSAASNVESLSMIPGRVCVPVVAGAVLVRSFRQKAKMPSTWWFAVAGALSALGALNNVEFGLPAAVAALVVVTVATYRSQMGLVNMLSFVGGSISVALLYATFSFAVNGPYDFRYRLGVYAGRRYSPGEIFPALSFHNIMLAIFVAAIVLGLIGMSGGSTWREELRAPSTLSVYGGIWGLLAFPYCAYRCVAGMYMSTQIYLVPLLVAIAGIVGMTWKQMSHWLQHDLSTSLLALPLALVTALTLASVVQAPNPIDEWRRVTGRALNDGWSMSSGRAPANRWDTGKVDWLDLAVVNLAQREFSSESIGYFGYMGNSVELATGMRNYSRVNSGEVLSIVGNEQIRQLACARVEASGPRFLLVIGFQFPCRGYSDYSLLEAAGITGQVLVRN